MHAAVLIRGSIARRHLLEAGKNTKKRLKAASCSKIENKKLEMAKSINIGLDKIGRKCCFQMKVIFVQAKHSRVVRIKKGEHRAVQSCLINEVVKYRQNKMFWEMFGFSELGSLMPIEGMMNLYKYIAVIDRNVIPDIM